MVRVNVPLLANLQHGHDLSRSEAFQMVINIAELGVDDRQALKVMPDIQFFRHAHAAMQLHGLLTDKAT